MALADLETPARNDSGIETAIGILKQRFGERLKTSQAAVSYVEGRRRLRASVLEKYAAALETTSELLTAGVAEGFDDSRSGIIHDAFEVVRRDEDFGFGARSDELLSEETMLDIVRLYERYKGIHLLPLDLA